MNCHQHLRPELTKLPTLLRLRQGNRYAIAIQNTDGNIDPRAYWTELQALLATGTSEDLWPCVATEVFSMIHRDDLPPGALLFARQSRRKQILSVVAWSTDGIYPSIYTSAEIAAEALYTKPPAQVENSCEAITHSASPDPTVPAINPAEVRFNGVIVAENA